MMKQPVIVVNMVGDKGRLKASIVADRCLWAGITYTYQLVGECHTITVSEADVRKAMGVE